jgi:hypothetical protein
LTALLWACSAASKSYLRFEEAAREAIVDRVQLTTIGIALSMGVGGRHAGARAEPITPGVTSHLSHLAALPVVPIHVAHPLPKQTQPSQTRPNQT